MIRELRLIFLATAAVSAAVAVFVVLTLPARRLVLDGRLPANAILGAYHVHSNRSDGSGTVDDIAAAAARAGLNFVVLTDHGDGTRVPEAAVYRHGVLCIDALEISTEGGHVVALGLDRAAPYPLAGDPRDVIEDVHRLGGTAVIAHPDSPSEGLRWSGPASGWDGIEWLNADSMWRDETPAHLVVTALRAIIRPPEAVASMFDRPVRTLQRWDQAARGRDVFSLVALDAHARLAWDMKNDPNGRTLLARPTYEAMFRTLAQVALLDRPLDGGAEADGARVMQAIEEGRSYSVIRVYAEPGVLEFSGSQPGMTVGVGGTLPDAAALATFVAVTPGAPGVRVSLMRDGRRVASGQGRVSAPQGGAGVFRVEVELPGAPAPWIVSNGIRVGPLRESPPPPEAALPEGSTWVAVTADPARWAIEKDPASTARVIGEGNAIRFEYALAPGRPGGQYAAAATPIQESAGIDRIRFSARASQPMRVSVQVRLPVGKEGQRWRRSVYVDQTLREVTLDLQDFEPVDFVTTQRPIAVPLHALLFVVDTLNSRPGTSGDVWLSNISLSARPPEVMSAQ